MLSFTLHLHATHAPQPKSRATTYGTAHDCDCTADGKTVLEYYELDGISKHNYLGFLALFFGFFFLCAWATLSFKKYSSR